MNYIDMLDDALFGMIEEQNKQHALNMLRREALQASLTLARKLKREQDKALWARCYHAK